MIESSTLTKDTGPFELYDFDSVEEMNKIKTFNLNSSGKLSTRDQSYQPLKIESFSFLTLFLICFQLDLCAVRIMKSKQCHRLNTSLTISK